MIRAKIICKQAKIGKNRKDSYWNKALNPVDETIQSSTSSAWDRPCSGKFCVQFL